MTIISIISSVVNAIVNILKSCSPFKKRFQLEVDADGVDQYDYRGNFSKKHNVTIRNVGKETVILAKIGYVFENSKGDKNDISKYTGNAPEVRDALLELLQKRKNLNLKPGEVVNLEIYCPYEIKYLFPETDIVYAEDTVGRKYYSKRIVKTNLGNKNDKN